MINPADDIFDNIRRKVRLNEAVDVDDVIFLLRELNTQVEMLSKHYLSICEYFDKQYQSDIGFYADGYHVPQVAKDALKWLVSNGYDPDFDWRE